ncbi:MAG TPA: metalloregulator ArsR/SmtB family transcription factor [Gaiellaceae bacterium]|nr:metalloregulator ArsR/SmtB family transcription factor [Gaiellaceae bacterium]
MIADADIAAVGAALADPSRSAMLLALVGGDDISAGELARIAGRSPSGASAHLRTLCDTGLVVAEESGRNRFFRLAGPDVAEALEVLARVAPARKPTSLRQSEAARALKRARTCYDHLAGELGVAVTEALVANELLRGGDDCFHVTDTGRTWLGELGIAIDQLERRRRSFARACLDWTERRPHLAGALGAAVADVFFARGWVRRLPGGRAVALSPAGRAWLLRELGLCTV